MIGYGSREVEKKVEITKKDEWAIATAITLVIVACFVIVVSFFKLSANSDAVVRELKETNRILTLLVEKK